MFRVLITGAIHGVGLELLRAQADVDVSYRPDLPYDEILSIISTFDCILTRSETRIDKGLIDAGAPRLKVVSRAAVGVGNIDIPYATEKGILVLNTPGQNTNSAAELTIGLLIACMRNLMPAHRKMKSGGWDRHKFAGNELLNKRIGLVGLGNVGHRVAQFANGFDMQVYAYDPYISDESFRAHGAEKCETLEQLLKKVDILSVHVPKNRETTGMIGKAELARLPEGAIVINAARGGIVDEGALEVALESGHIRSAGIDTWAVEPVVEHPLKAFEQVVMSPHIGATTEEAQFRIARMVAQQTMKALRGEIVDTPINMPHVGAELSHDVQGYSVLAERLGWFAAQYIDFNPSHMNFLYRGELGIEGSDLIRLAFMKGYLRRTVDEDTHISFINALQLIEQRGIQISESENPQFRPYRTAMRVRISSDEHHFDIGGTVFDGTHGRFTYLNGYPMEMEPFGHLLLVENDDRPGVVGRVGMVLGEHGVNIDAFELSRKQKGGEAMALVRVDEIPSDEILAKLRVIPGLRSVKLINL